jgi:hypothetical protein
VYQGDVGFCPHYPSNAPCSLASQTQFGVITEQQKFFQGSFTCIVGLAYPSIAQGGITPCVVTSQSYIFALCLVVSSLLHKPSRDSDSLLTYTLSMIPTTRSIARVTLQLSVRQLC